MMTLPECSPLFDPVTENADASGTVPGSKLTVVLRMIADVWETIVEPGRGEMYCNACACTDTADSEIQIKRAATESQPNDFPTRCSRFTLSSPPMLLFPLSFINGANRRKGRCDTTNDSGIPRIPERREQPQILSKHLNNLRSSIPPRSGRDGGHIRVLRIGFRHETFCEVYWLTKINCFVGPDSAVQVSLPSRCLIQ